jgi:membrane associated rhomboid family serine protease
MGISSRDYYRDSSAYYGAGGWGLEGLTPVVKYLIAANVIVFLLQIFIVREVRLSPLEEMRKHDPKLDRLLTEKEEEGPEAFEAFKKEHPEFADPGPEDENDIDTMFKPRQKVSVVQEWFQLDTRKVLRQGQVWRLLTHAFCHDRLGIIHILFNMLFLYWFGCTIESMYGPREFLLFYLTAALMSAFAFMGLQLWTGTSVPAVGASGAVLAVTMLYTVHFPTEEICICWIIPVQMRWVMVLYVIWDLHPVLLALAGDQLFGGIAHAGHLGGLLFGFLYGWYGWSLETLGQRIPGLRWRRKRSPPVRRACKVDRVPARDPEMSQVDELLEKISVSGQDSLTDEERTLLRNASERIRARLKRDS